MQQRDEELQLRVVKRRANDDAEVFQ
jgi:hypothetical protein